MPRLARLDALGVIHHAIIRGIDLKAILRDNRDRDDMMERLADLLPSLKTVSKEEVILERSGKPMAAMIPIGCSPFRIQSVFKRFCINEKRTVWFMG